MELKVTHANDTAFHPEGLRGYFEYRDLGIALATDGRFGMHLIRAKEGRAPSGEWHRHDLAFQAVLVLKGWVVFEYEGAGQVRLEAGSCVHQPPGIRHREIEHSRDLEMLEVVAPARFATSPA